jgi:class 3 adenylate cyclase
MVGELVSAGENLVACDLASDGLRQYRGDTRLRQLKAIALSRSGASLKGLELVRELEREGSTDQETIGMLGSIYKDLWKREIDPGRRDELLGKARDYYLRAYELPDGNYWSGINAATLALVAGDDPLARDLASRVRDECRQDVGDVDIEGYNYWSTATLGEASLILRDLDEAERWYRIACDAAGNRLGDIASTRRNALMILRHLDAGETVAGAILESIAVPAVVVFAGHMIDRPGRKKPRFPQELEAEVAGRILERLRSRQRVIGFSSAACGADILFLEALDSLGAEFNIVLPFDEQQFIEESVAYADGGSWVPRFRNVMDRAWSVTIASPYKTDDEGLAFEYTNMVLLGLAQMKRRELEGEMVAMAVWDGRPGDGFGGTRSNMRRWARLDLEVDQIPVSPPEGMTVRREEGIPMVQADPEPPGSMESKSGDFFNKPEVRAVMFADLVGYTRLSESQIVDYVKHFMGAVSRLVEASGSPPVFSNTWGDGIFMVFRDVRDAGLFALDLCDLVRRTNWKSMGLEEDRSLRIALHAGPVQQCEDPITGRPGYFGSHVGRAARMEPITEPGQVYTSGQFAALAECYGIDEFRCDYVGRIPHSKGYGAYPTYHLSRTREETTSLSETS